MKYKNDVPALHVVNATMDYSLFFIIKGNRPICKTHLKKLKEEISIDNQLHLHPIIVDSEMNIIDGQHRLEVAKLLKVPIYFIKSESITEKHIISTNVNQKKFTIGDYLNYSLLRYNSKEYERLINYMNCTKLGLKAIITLLLGTLSSNIIDLIKSGKFKFPDSEGIEDIIQLYLDLDAFIDFRKIKPRSMISNVKFTKALRWLYLTSNFDKEVFFKRLADRWHELHPQGTVEDWYKLLLNIYNFKNRTPISDEFTQQINYG